MGKLTTEYSHLKSATDMCDTLLNKHQFGLDGIATILSIAGKYGHPANVLKALDVYGNLKLMTNNLEEMQGKVEEKEKLLHQLEGKHQVALKHVDSLCAKALKVGAEVSKVENKLEEYTGVNKLMFFVKSPTMAAYAEYGQVAVLFAQALLNWSSVNEQKLKYPLVIEEGLKALIAQLGGD